MSDQYIISPTLTSQVRDIVYTLGQQAQATSSAAGVTRYNQPRILGQLYTNTAKSAVLVSISLSATGTLYIGGLLAGVGPSLVGIVNPGELYYVGTATTTAVGWVEYAY